MCCYSSLIRFCKNLLGKTCSGKHHTGVYFSSLIAIYVKLRKLHQQKPDDTLLLSATRSFRMRAFVLRSVLLQLTQPTNAKRRAPYSSGRFISLGAQPSPAAVSLNVFSPALSDWEGSGAASSLGKDEEKTCAQTHANKESLGGRITTHTVIGDVCCCHPAR